MATLNENILLSGINFNNTDTALITGGAAAAGLPLSNLLITDMWELARFAATAAASTYCEIDYLSARPIQLAAILKHNLSQYAKWRVRLASTQAGLTGAPLYDSGWLDAYPANTGFNVLPWGEFSWGDLGIVSTGPAGFVTSSFHPMTEQITARWMRIDIDDADMAAARLDEPYIELARLWAGPIYQPSLNSPYGAEVIPLDLTKKVDAESGVRHYQDKKVRMRAVSAGFNSLPKTELLTKIVGQHFMVGGISSEMICILEPKDPSTFAFSAVHGNLKETPASTYSVWNRMDTSIYVEEAV